MPFTELDKELAQVHQCGGPSIIGLGKIPPKYRRVSTCWPLPGFFVDH